MNNKSKRFKIGKTNREFLFGETRLFSSIREAADVFRECVRNFNGIPNCVYNNSTGIIWSLFWQATFAYNKGFEFKKVPSAQFLCEYVRRKTK